MKKLLAVAIQALEYLKDGETNKPHFIKHAEEVIKEAKKEQKKSEEIHYELMIANAKDYLQSKETRQKLASDPNSVMNAFDISAVLAVATGKTKEEVIMDLVKKD